MNRYIKKIIKTSLLGGGLLLIFLLIKKIGVFEIAGVINHTRWTFVILGVSVYLILIITRSLRWFILARVIKKDIKYWRFLPFYLINSLMGNITPFKSGEAATPFLFKKYLGIELGSGFFVVIIDRFFDLWAFALVLIGAILYFLSRGATDAFLFSAFWIIMVILFFVLVILVLAFLSKKAIFGLARFFHILKFIEKELVVFYGALAFLKDKKVYRFLGILTAFCWIFESMAYWLVFNSVSPVAFLDAISVQMIAAAGTLLTFIPNGIGVGEVSMVYLLGLLKYPAVFATSGVLMIRVFLGGTLLSTGLLGLVILGRSAPKGAENSEGRS